MSSMAKLRYSRWCFITSWRVFYKCLQLVQGVIMLILITIILLFNFEENISYVFLFFRIPLSFYGLLCFVLERKGRKNLTINAVAGFAMHCSLYPRVFEVVRCHYIKMYQANFLLCYVKFIPIHRHKHMKLFINIVVKGIYLFYTVAWNNRKKLGFPACNQRLLGASSWMNWISVEKTVQ